MQMVLIPYKVLFKRLFLLLILYSVCRFCFFALNFHFFESAGSIEITLLFFYGLRFDIYAILITNALFILMHILPFPVFNKLWYQRLIKIVFYVFNIPALIFNAIDFAFYRYSQKRTTADFFHLFGMGDDMKNNIVVYISDYWYILLIVAVLIVFIEVFYRRTYLIQPKAIKINYLLQSILLIPAIALFVIGARGGIQYKPINMQTAARYATPQLIPIVLNTPFTIIKTLGKNELNDIKYMNDEAADKLFSPNQEINDSLPFKPMNVVVIILESFSKEYIGYFNQGKGYTPFLDSLITQSFVCENAFANGKRSIEGIPAVVASIPALMDEPFITSAYNANSINSIASVLKSKGYQSAFFHGGNNGTMGFDNFSRLAGYDHYYGRNEYIGDKSNYDGNWGIFDEPYYHYCISKFDEMNKPFVTTIFSLSSHHPYLIPPKYKDHFPKGTQPIHETVGYADQALKSFFMEAEQKAWFKNTLFVITADHTGPAEKSEYQTRTGIYEIPIIYYCPGQSLKGKTNTVTQHCDILPSILSYLNFNGNYSAFGKNIFLNRKENFAVNYMNNSFQYINNNYLLQFDGDRSSGLYDYHNDVFLEHNLIEVQVAVAKQLEQNLKAIIQQYRQGMLHNSLIKK